MRNKTDVLLAVCILLFGILLSHKKIEAAKTLQFKTFFTEDINDTLAGMNLEEKVGQVMIFGFWGMNLDDDYETWLSSGRLGNIKIFRRNVESKEQLQALTGRITLLPSFSEHGIPPFIATDMEGGVVNHIRHPGTFLAPSAGHIGASGDTEYGKNVSRLIALTLLDHGINMNFAPCADVLTNPANRVISTRSYSSDPNIVYNMAKIFIDEHEKVGILTMMKHFPGHGMTDFDSHLFSSSVDITKEELYRIHIFPYRKLINEKQLDGCMVSHIIYNEIDPVYPAAFSYQIIEGLLRDELSFKGIVVTDDLEMEGSQSYAQDIVQAFILAFNAGNDLLLISHTKEKQVKLLDQAVELFKNGTLSEDKLDQKVLRILKEKKDYLTRFYTNLSYEDEYEIALKQSERIVSNEANEGIVRVSSNIKGSIPDYYKAALRDHLNGLILAPTSKFADYVKKYLPTWNVINIGYFPERQQNKEDAKKVQQDLKNYDIILLGFATIRQIEWAEACIQENVPFGILSIYNPLVARQFAKEALFIVTSFGPHSPATDALFKNVFETGEFSGTFPYHFK